MSVALVSILGPDRVGLVAAVAGYLFGAGVNLRDAAFAALGAGAEFVAVCELPADVTVQEIEAGLGGIPELEGAQVRVVPYAFDPDAAERGRITHRIAISGGDQLGLVARLSEIFAHCEANIVRLEARKLSEAEGGIYVTHFAVSIAPEHANRCLAAVGSTAGALSLDCRIEPSSV